MFKENAWEAYKSLNERFADEIVANYRENDISKDISMTHFCMLINAGSLSRFKVWVNDYHLMLLPGMLRKRLPRAVIGFFLHIPFPSSELFRCLPSK